MADLQRLQYSSGDHANLGMLFGAGVGVALAGALAFRPRDDVYMTTSGKVAAFAVTGILSGALFGAIGRIIGSSSFVWVNLDVP